MAPRSSALAAARFRSSVLAAARFLLRVWGFLRHILATRGLLQWAGWWETATAMLVSLALAIGSLLKGLPWPIAALVALAAFTLVSVVWRVFVPKAVPAQGQAPPPRFSTGPPQSGDTRRVPILKFECWHADNHAPRLHLGTPSFVRVRNVQTAIKNSADDVIAHVEYENVAGTRFTVTQAAWWEVRDDGKYIGRGWVSRPSLRGNEAQSFVLFVSSENRVFVTQNLLEPLGMLEEGHWEARIKVTANNAVGFRGTLGFTVLPNGGVCPDSPAYQSGGELLP